MRAAAELRTPRLLLRQWRPGDEVVLAKINSDPEVTRYLIGRVDHAATRGFCARAMEHWDVHGFGLWAVESREPSLERAFLGFIGLAHPSFMPVLASRVEIGWRLARRAWGRGLATEGAIAARDHAFDTLRLPELISIIDPRNTRSQRVAAKLGMAIGERVVHPVAGAEVEVWILSRPASQAPS